MSILQSFLAVALFGLMLAALYHYFLLVVSIAPIAREETIEARENELKFVVLVPAHNEASVIGQTVNRILGMQYKQELFDVIVIADNCDDSTAKIARESGAECFEREDRIAIGKGFALGWYFRNVLTEDKSYDAAIVFDADSQPSVNFLEIMSANLQRGYRVVQGQHIISNPNENVYTRLADIGMRLTNRLRNRARNNLGLSCRLMGDAMCLRRSVLETYPWDSSSLVEDREYGIQMIKHGVHIKFEPEAKSYGEAAAGLTEAQSQRIRWSGGVVSLRRNNALSLLSIGVRNRDFSALDRAIELVLPPYSILLIVSMALLVLQIIFPSLNSTLSYPLLVGNTVAWLMIPPLGLVLDRAPMDLFPYLLLGPLYAIWRAWIIILTLIRFNQLKWTRTKRSGE